MNQEREMRAEREYLERVKMRLLDTIDEARALSSEHAESIRMITADAWEELRVRPTQISQMEMQQLATECDRFSARKAFAEEEARRAEKMLPKPYFGRVDFCENGTENAEKIMVGLYALPDEDGRLMVYDWRAPVCGLYYDALPGKASYRCPDGVIEGEMTLKRQYSIENGALQYFIDTGESIDDTILLDLLSGAASTHMKQIVSTIQAEQNAAIRSEGARVVSVVGGAGSGKTSIAMHRAAYLMYRRGAALEASRIQILSPGTAFSEYVSTVLPELGEENIRARTLYEMVCEILGRRTESPVHQAEELLRNGDPLRIQSMEWKTGGLFARELKRFCDTFTQNGPEFGDVLLDGKVYISAKELREMYARESRVFSACQRLEHMSARLDTRMESLGERLYKQYERAYEGKYSGRELKNVCRMAVSQQLQPIRLCLRSMLEVSGEKLLADAMKDAPKALRDAYNENNRANLTWWEDAVAEAYLRVRLGFVKPDRTVSHLLVDEAQDYSETALMLLNEYLPNASVTLLGDPMQRTTPGMPPCDPDAWGMCFGAKNAPVYRLSKCYRSTLPIANLCAKILGADSVNAIGRGGEAPVVRQYSEKLLKETLARYREKGYQSIAVITRTRAQADSLSEKLDHVYRLDGDDQDLAYEATDNIVAGYHLTKGLEFDAVVVVWPDCALTDGERRRLYTACSRALHEATLLAGGGLMKQLKL